MKRLVLALLAIILSAPALAQSTPLMPYTYPVTVSTSSAQAVGVNSARRRIDFYNPNATVSVAVCPSVSRSNSAAIACTVNGAGSITLLPYASYSIVGVGGNPSVPSAWNAIGSGSGALTVFEFE